MSIDTNISIAGVSVILTPISRQELKGLSLDMILTFQYYKTVFNQQELCIVAPKDNKQTLTPKQYRRMAEQIEQAIQIPVAFLLPTLSYVQRARFIEQGVYFIISDQYVFLPGVLINARLKQKQNTKEKLSATAQYLLLHYLLDNKLDNFTLLGIEDQVPYSYQLISRAISELEDKDLFTSHKDKKTKFISSKLGRKALWEKAQPFLVSPVKKVVYSNRIILAPFFTGGITALSHYSSLSPDPQQTMAIWDKDFDKEDRIGLEENDPDSRYRIEIWNYPPSMGIWQSGYADRLSLYLSLRDNKDPRVQKELEIIINKIWQ